MSWGGVRAGDWVKTTGPVATGFLGCSEIKTGTLGVVTRTAQGWFAPKAEVDFDGGFGTVAATVPVSRLRVVRRDGGVDGFRARQGRVTAARTALTIFLVWPVIAFVAQYVWINHGFSGITGALAIGILDSIGYYLTMLITNPIGGLIYLGFLAWISRLAWH